MMQASKEFAEALFMLAREEGAEDAYRDALGLISGLFSENPEYVDFLASPGIPAAERTGALEAAFGDAIPGEVLSFLQLFCERGYMAGFGECAAEYESLYKQWQNISTAEVKSAVPLTQTQKDALKAKLEAMSGRTVILVCTVDPALMGGLTVAMDGKVIDGSLRHRLSEVKDVMKQ